MMSKYRSMAIKEFMLAAWNQFGMCVVVVAAFLEDREPLVSLWVEGPTPFHS